MDRVWTERKEYKMTLLELAHQAGIKPKWVASTGGGEYHSSCPVCGGTDRFFIQPNRQMSKCLGSYRCRQCGIYGDAIKFACEFLSYSFPEAAQAVNAIITEKTSWISLNTSLTSRSAALQAPPTAWIERATEFVHQAHETLLQKKEVLAHLANRGLPLEAVIRYKLGWADKSEFFSRAAWGLNEEVGQDGKQRSLWIPKGLVIPSIANNQVIRLKVRRFDWQEEDRLPKYVAISGSMGGLSVIGPSGKTMTIMVVVESELDAYAIDYVAHDFVCAIAVGSNIKNPDKLTDRLARHAKHLLICHDNDEAGKKMLIKWQGLYSHAIGYPTPIGKDIGEAVQQGFNIREWLFNAKGQHEIIYHDRRRK